MNVDDGLQGWMENKNWWVHLMRWKKVGSHDDMVFKRVGSSGGAYFGCGRLENGVKWWGMDTKITLDKAC
jgi:hypothetical protein